MSEQTTNLSGDVFPITLFARVLEGSDGTFIVTATLPKDGEDLPGIAVRPIAMIDDGQGSPIAAALLREYSEMHADTTLRTHATMFTVDDDGATVPVLVPLRPSLKPDDITADPDDDITKDAGEE